MTDCSVPHVCSEAKVTAQLASLSPTAMCIRVSKNHRPFFFTAAIVLCVAFYLHFSSTSSESRKAKGQESICLPSEQLKGFPVLFIMFLDH